MALVNVDAEFIGKYKLRGVLGTGNTGEVKLGVHTETGEKVAIKVIPKSPATSKQAINLRREICYLKLIDHPNIVRLMDVAEGSNCTLIVMEYISGTELFYRIKERVVKEKDMRFVFRQIVDALDYCHRHGILHRDLKPENVLIDKHNNIKIIDFGFSNMLGEDGYLETRCGSPHYLAPEIILGGRYGPSIDVWSLGVILYVAVTGSFPFDGRNLQGVYESILKDRIEFPRSLSPECVDLITRMLTRDAGQRATLEDVRTHPWTNKGYDAPPTLHRRLSMHPFPAEEMDEELLAELASMGFPREDVVSALQSGTQNLYSTAYVLLTEKKAKQVAAAASPAPSVTPPRERKGILSRILHPKHK